MTDKLVMHAAGDSNRYPRTMCRWILATLFVCAAPALGQDATSSSGNAQTPASDDTRISSEPLVSESGPQGESVTAEVKTEAGDVQATDYGTFNLNARDIALSQILEMLAEVSQRNILAGNDVNASISVNLYDVTFEEALHAVLEVGGCASIEEGNFIYVHPKEHVDAVLAARRQTETRVFDLHHIGSSEAKEITDPLLGETGSSVALGAVDPGFAVGLDNGGGDSYAYNAQLVVTAYPDQLDQVAALLAEVDVPPQQVMIEATILSARVNEDNAFGVNMSFVTSLDFTQFANPLNVVNALSSGTTSTSNAIAGTTGIPEATVNSGFQVGVIKDNFAFFLRALDEVTDTNIIARPRVLCLNRQRGRIYIGNEDGYITTTLTDTSSTQNVEYLETGVKLEFRPFIGPDDTVRLELYPSLSTGSVENASTDPALPPVLVPNKAVSEVVTNVKVRTGETIVLGGLFHEAGTIQRDNVPLLGDIPLVGNAFRGQNDSFMRQEIIFMLTPDVIKDEKLADMGANAMDVMDAVRVGMRSGLLPWSRDRMTADYNRDALNAFREGELDLALYYADNSLRLNAHQPELRALRRAHAGQADAYWERHMMRDILAREMLEHPPGGDE